MGDRGADHAGEHDGAERLEGEIAEEDLEGEEHPGDGGVKNRGDSARDPASHQRVHVVALDPDRLSEAASDGRPDLDDRPFGTGRPTRADGQRARYRLGQRHPRADDPALAIGCVHDFGHTVAARFAGEEMGDQTAGQGPNHGHDQQHESAEVQDAPFLQREAEPQLEQLVKQVRAHPGRHAHDHREQQQRAVATHADFVQQCVEGESPAHGCRGLLSLGTRVGRAVWPVCASSRTILTMNQNPANPRVGKNVYIAPTAYVGGDVRLGDGATVMHHAAIRGDIAPIRVGARTNVQDGSVLHTRYGIPLDIADEVVIGHRAVVHCRSVGTRTLIGIGAIILDEAEIGNHCIIAAGAVVTPGTQVPDGSVFGGVPARLLRPTHDGDRAEIARIVESYVEVGGRHAAGWYPNIADAAANHPGCDGGRGPDGPGVSTGAQG
jgi:carbonic anhydrase/acetyltransferase-like protein (isoleucine patch superfamily)